MRVALRKLAPALAVTYVSDSGATPYGKLAPAALEERLRLLTVHLASRGVRRVFLACNAASTTLARGARYALPTEGMIEAGVATALASGARRVGVVGGRRTIASGVYRRMLGEHGIQVVSRVAQPLSAAIEAGAAEAPSTFELVRRLVEPLRDVDALLLACTHYPAARRAFVRALPGVELLDPAAHAAERILAMAGASAAAAEPMEDAVFTSGDPSEMRRAARSAFGVELGVVRRLRLDTLRGG